MLIWDIVSLHTGHDLAGDKGMKHDCVKVRIPHLKRIPLQQTSGTNICKFVCLFVSMSKATERIQVRLMRRRSPRLNSLCQ